MTFGKLDLEELHERVVDHHWCCECSDCTVYWNAMEQEELFNKIASPESRKAADALFEASDDELNRDLDQTFEKDGW